MSVQVLLIAVLLSESRLVGAVYLCSCCLHAGSIDVLEVCVGGVDVRWWVMLMLFLLLTNR
jgi:hypothetical protein